MDITTIERIACLVGLSSKYMFVLITTLFRSLTIEPILLRLCDRICFILTLRYGITHKRKLCQSFSMCISYCCVQIMYDFDKLFKPSCCSGYSITRATGDELAPTFKLAEPVNWKTKCRYKGIMIERTAISTLLLA